MDIHVSSYKGVPIAVKEILECAPWGCETCHSGTPSILIAVNTLVDDSACTVSGTKLSACHNCANILPSVREYWNQVVIPLYLGRRVCLSVLRHARVVFPEARIHGDI